MFTFNKASRFPKIDKTGKTDSIYNIPSSITNRKTTLGYGKKSDFTKGFYRGTEYISIKRDFDKGNEPGVKYTFGLERDKFKKQVVPGFKNFDKYVPGPAIYNVIKKTGSDSPYYSLHTICGETQWINRHMKNPGPGEYSTVIRINSAGKYPVSKISNIKANNFGLDKTDRWKRYRENGIPAPNAYFADKVLMGNIYNSKFRSGHYITMSKRLKKCGYKNDYPGPGSYLRFSEFGILVPKNYKRGYSACNTLPSRNKKDKYEAVKTDENISYRKALNKIQK
jgi:hypothetical protein